mgnify:FL=1
MMYPFLVISDSFSSTSSIKREARELPDYLRCEIEQNQIFVQKREGGAYRLVPDSNVCNDRIQYGCSDSMSGPFHDLLHDRTTTAPYHLADRSNVIRCGCCYFFSLRGRP